MKNIVVTGAGKGLGLEMTKLHLDKGDRVIAITHTITEELKSLKGDIVIFTCELTREEDIAGIFNKFEDKINILYNIAGLYYEDQRGGVSDTDMDKALKMYQVNAMAPLCVLKYAKKLLSDDAIVVNVSSEAGSITACGRDSEYGYCMSKAALNMASKMFSNEIKDTDIKVFCYHPGWMRTQMGGERAAASEFSISAKESADRLIELVKNIRSMDGMFYDYLNEKWDW